MVEAISQANPKLALAALSEDLHVNGNPRLIAKALRRRAKLLGIDRSNPEVKKLRGLKRREFKREVTELGLKPRQMSPVELYVAQQILAQANQPKEQAAASGQNGQSQPPATIPMQQPVTSSLLTRAKSAFARATAFGSQVAQFVPQAGAA